MLFDGEVMGIFILCLIGKYLSLVLKKYIFCLIVFDSKLIKYLCFLCLLHELTY